MADNIFTKDAEFLSEEQLKLCAVNSSYIRLEAKRTTTHYLITFFIWFAGAIILFITSMTVIHIFVPNFLESADWNMVYKIDGAVLYAILGGIIRDKIKEYLV